MLPLILPIAFVGGLLAYAEATGNNKDAAAKAPPPQQSSSTSSGTAGAQWIPAQILVSRFVSTPTGGAPAGVDPSQVNQLVV
jgi:hypothetical protein